MGDILNHLEILKYFVIGNTTLQKKIDLYQKVMLYVFKDYQIEMGSCEGFLDNKGLYIFW